MLNTAIAGLEICAAQVFDQKLSCSPRQVAEAVHWLIDQEVRLINMSFGLREDRPVLRLACEAAVAAGICLVAASPARGDPVYPAAYPGVVRATGDARCQEGEIACLDTAQADFGGYPGNPQSVFVGASAGCAAVCVALAELAVDNPKLSAAELARRLTREAHYRGPERRVSAAPVSDEVIQ
jgi:subtilisin family serine protease